MPTAEAGNVPPGTPGFWTKATIAARLAASEESGVPIIAKWCATRLERASYRLRVGEECYVSPTSDTDPKTKQLLKDRHGGHIPPGQFAFLTTEEDLHIPSDCLAFIALRSRQTKFRGLVNVSGFHVDPGYEGKLVFAVFNAGPGPVHFARGDEWFEIFFASLDGEADVSEKKREFKGIPSELITPLAGEFQTFTGLKAKIDDTKEELDARIQKIEREHTVVRWSAALILGALIALGIRMWSSNDSQASSATNTQLQLYRAANAN